MSGALEHRGPDDRGDLHQDLGGAGSLFLANSRLAILDLSSRGHQPMTTPDGRFTIVFNGEVYNFRRIADELRESGVRFVGESDTEVILHAWQRWGHECLDRFRGMFAFAIFDARDRRLFLARDRLGEKPLYYWSNGRVFLFASEVRCLLASNVVPRSIDREGLDAFLTFGSVVDPYTIVEGVRALEPGHFAEVVRCELSAQPYWEMSKIEELEGGVSSEDAASQVGGLLREACRLVMESDVPVGVLLSGGIDSTTNVVLLSELGFSDLRTFSVVFPDHDPDLSERPWASLVAERFGTTHEWLEVDLAKAKAWVAKGVTSMDQPSVDGINTYLVTRAIAEAGIKVAVSGQGGDELFLGYPQRHRFAAMARLAGLPVPGIVQSIMGRVARTGRLADTRFEKLLELAPRAQDRFVSAYLANHTLYSQSALDRLSGEARPRQSRFVRSQGGSSPLGRLSRLELSYYLRNTLLRDADQMSMANSIELRQPFLDARLVEAVLRLPIETKIRRGEQKPLLVAGVGARLPHEVVDRPKMGFNLPYDSWLREGLSLCNPLDIPVGLDEGEMRAVGARFDAGAYWTRFWALQVLASWVDRHNLSEPR